MDPKNRDNIREGLEVGIVAKPFGYAQDRHNQASGELTQGVVEEILTNSSFHPQGIKVRLTTGEVGRVQEIL